MKNSCLKCLWGTGVPVDCVLAFIGIFACKVFRTQTMQWIFMALGQKDIGVGAHMGPLQKMGSNNI